MAPQGIPIDPNLTVNAFSNGAATAFNYGPQAQVARQADIDAQNAQSRYAFGQGAENLRAANTGLIRANTGMVQAQTSTALIANDITLYDLAQRKLNQQEYGNLERANRGLAAEYENQDRQQIQAFHRSPAALVQNQKIIEANALLETNKSIIAAKTIESQIKNLDLSTQTDYANLQIGNAQVSRQRDTVLNRQRIATDITAAQQADAQLRAATGNPYPQQQISLVNRLVTSDYQAFKDNADVLAPMLSNLDQVHGLTPELRAQLSEAKKAADYTINGTAIKNTVGGIVQARAGGQVSPGGAAILSRAAEIGIDVNDENDRLNITVDSTNGLYTLVNGRTGQRSRPMGQDEYDASPELQTIHVAAQKRQRNLTNPLTKTDIAQAQLQKIASNAFIPEVGASFTYLINSLAPEISDVPGFTTRTAGTMKEFQQNLQSFNPFFGPEGAGLFEGTNIGDNILSRGINSIQDFIGFPDEDSEMIRKRFKNSPALAQQVAEAYKNRLTGGMPVAVFNSTVDKIVSQTTASDPRYQVTPINSPDAVRELTTMLRSKVQRSLAVPTNEVVLRQAYRIATEVHPRLGGQDTTVLTQSPVGILNKVSRGLQSVSNSLFGADQSDLTRFTAVPEQ